MADTVSTVTAWNGKARGDYITRFTNQSDGTGESAVAKIDVSALLNPAGRAATKVQIERIEYAINGFNYVHIYWDRASDVTIAVLPLGSGVMDFTSFGGFNDPGAGGTGDVVFTTDGAIDGAAYDMTVYYRAQ